MRSFKALNEINGSGSGMVYWLMTSSVFGSWIFESLTSVGTAGLVGLSIVAAVLNDIPREKVYSFVKGKY